MVMMVMIYWLDLPPPPPRMLARGKERFSSWDSRSPKNGFRKHPFVGDEVFPRILGGVDSTYWGNEGMKRLQ